MIKVISGGQTGADRGGIEAALELGLPYGGTIPRGRKAEDGQVPAHFDRLCEHHSADYPPRTRINVADADATVIFCRLPMRGGSATTLRFCREQGKPVCVFGAEKVLADPARVAEQLATWIERQRGAVKVLNVAGSRESTAPGIGVAVKQAIRQLLLRSKRPSK